MDKAEMIRVVPASSKGGPVGTMGTRLFSGDQELTGITRLTLHCDLDDVWRATVECMVMPPAVDAVAEYRYPVTLMDHLRAWWRSRG